MKSAMEKLTQLGGELYAEAQKAQAAAGAGAGAGEAAGPAEGGAKRTEKKADVVDADFEVVDEDKKK